MVKIFVRAATCVAALGLASACAQKAPDPATLVAAADALDTAFADAFTKGDVDGLMSLYWNSPDLLSFGPSGMGIKGWQAVKADTAQAMSALKGGRFEFLGRQNTAMGDVVVGWGTWRITVPVEGGQPMVLEGRYTDVKAMRDGKMVYLHDHGSVPWTPPSAPAAGPAGQ